VLARFAGAVLAFLGVCWVVGWLQTFRGRLLHARLVSPVVPEQVERSQQISPGGLYLLFLGAAFIALGADLMLPGHLALAKLALLGVFVLSMAAAIVFAVLETRSRLAELAQRRQALEAEMQAYLEKLKACPERLPGQGSRRERAREKTE
jgi:hypothetical protein